QPERDRYGGGAATHPVEGRLDAGAKIADRDAERHREKNPDREIAVEKRQPSRDWCLYGGAGRIRHDSASLSCTLRAIARLPGNLQESAAAIRTIRPDPSRQPVKPKNSKITPES